MKHTLIVLWHLRVHKVFRMCKWVTVFQSPKEKYRTVRSHATNRRSCVTHKQTKVGLYFSQSNNDTRAQYLTGHLCWLQLVEWVVSSNFQWQAFFFFKFMGKQQVGRVLGAAKRGCPSRTNQFWSAPRCPWDSPWWRPNCTGEVRKTTCENQVFTNNDRWIGRDY